MKKANKGSENSKNEQKPKKYDNPEQYPTDKKSLHDMYESEQTVDPIPLEDLKLEQQEEKDGHHSKDSSSTEKKYQMDYKKH